MQILWLDINSSYSHSNLALPALHAQLDDKYDKEIEWKVARGTIKSPKYELVSQVIDFKPDVIFATAWLFNAQYLLSVIEDVYALIPSVRIVLGGPEFLGTPSENEHYLRSHPEVFAVFRGDAEEDFSDSLDALFSPSSSSSSFSSFSSVRGLCFIDNQGTYVDCGKASVRDFVSLIPPERSSFFDWSKPFVQLETSKGCFNSCTFCVSGIKETVRDLPLSSLEERLEHFVSCGIKEIRVLDRTFNAAPRRARALLELFSHFVGRLRFHLEVHPAFLSKELLSDLASMPDGLLHVEVGIQSLNDSVLETCGRRGSVEKALEGVKNLLAMKKFEIHSDLIVGLPGYSYEMILEDTLHLISLGVDEIQIELLKCLPGTSMRNNAAALGLTYSPSPPYRVLSNDVSSFDKIEKAMVLSKIIDQWFNNKSGRKTFLFLIKNAPEGFLSAFVDHCFYGGLLDESMSKESRWNLLFSFCSENYSSVLDYISIGWVENDMSIKKAPAARFRMWHPQDIVVNPLFKEGRGTMIYYYLESEQFVFWVSYDREVSKVKPFETQLKYRAN